MIMVDPLMKHGWKFRGKYIMSCHLITDNDIEELHKFAESIGLKRTWVQNKSLPHYDLTPNKRLQAVKNGAKEIDIKEMGKLIGKAKGYNGEKSDE